MRHDEVPPPQEILLADLVAVDQLGYVCIREDEIDLAFHASGKGVRLPRTCLPEPCRSALTQMQLAGLIGRPPVPAEWDDYFSRYADHCRKEVVPFDEADATDEIRDPADFWSPLIASYPPSAPIRGALPNRSGGGLASFLPVGGGSLGPGAGPGRGPGVPGTIIGDPDEDGSVPLLPPGPPDEPEPIPHAPLPGGLVLALTGIAFLLRARLMRTSH